MSPPIGNVGRSPLGAVYRSPLGALTLGESESPGPGPADNVAWCNVEQTRLDDRIIFFSQNCGFTNSPLSGYHTYRTSVSFSDVIGEPEVGRDKGAIADEDLWVAWWRGRITGILVRPADFLTEVVCNEDSPVQRNRWASPAGVDPDFPIIRHYSFGNESETDTDWYDASQGSSSSFCPAFQFRELIDVYPPGPPPV